MPARRYWGVELLVVLHKADELAVVEDGEAGGVPLPLNLLDLARLREVGLPASYLRSGRELREARRILHPKRPEYHLFSPKIHPCPTRNTPPRAPRCPCSHAICRSHMRV
jgi:hypothetical protein